jgi:hypothetical protein
MITDVKREVKMIKDKGNLNFIQWFWNRASFYIQEGKLPSWPYRYRRLQPYFIFKYYSTLGPIDLEKVVVGEINKGRILKTTFQWQTHQWNTSTEYLLKNSLFVEFLQLHGDKQTISEKEFLKTSYYKFMMGHFNRSGEYHGITDLSRSIEQANYFLKLYHSIINGSYEKEYKNYYKPGCFRSFSKYPTVIKLKDGFWGIRDGHHRLAAHYCLKNRRVPAHIVTGKEKIIWNS